jgi:uncharacterized protein (TIGR02246 family)
MNVHPVQTVVEQADAAINRQDLDAVIDFYDDDAVLVIEPGRLARGKAEIRKAFTAIFAYFADSLVVEQQDYVVLEAAGTALVMCTAKLDSKNAAGLPVSLVRKPTYVFKKDAAGKWKCVIDNSYGVELVTSLT